MITINSNHNLCEYKSIFWFEEEQFDHYNRKIKDKILIES